MMEDVRNGIINLVLVKDLSRFGRNYLDVGQYLEKELPAFGCRFVALSDGIDTETGEDDIIPFLNAVNDFYIKNLSDKIKVALTARAKDGQRLSGTCPYGYDRKPNERTRLIVDKYSAGVVRRIFELRAGGTGYTAIAGMLNQDSILPPRAYYYQKHGDKKRTAPGTTSASPAIWSTRTVKLMLQNELYIGNTVAFKRKTRSYRDNRATMRNEDEWIRTPCTHEPIVSKELWQKVQKINQIAKDKYSSTKMAQKSLFSGLMICPDCGANMGLLSKSYSCRTYHRSGNAVCSPHRISEYDLKHLVFDHIKEMAAIITPDEKGILKKIFHRFLDESKAIKQSAAAKHRRLEQQLYSLELQTEQLFEDKFDGNIPPDDFLTKINEAEALRQEVEATLEHLIKTTREAEVKIDDIGKWTALVKKRSASIEIDRDLLRNLIDKIEVGEKIELNGTIIRDVKIYYKCDGLW